MSGFEAIGLIMGIYPIVTQLAQTYSTMKLGGGSRQLSRKLETEATIYDKIARDLLASVASQEEIQRLVKQEEIQRLVQQEEIQRPVKQEEIHRLVQQEEIQRLVQQEEIQRLVQQEPDDQMPWREQSLRQRLRRRLGQDKLTLTLKHLSEMKDLLRVLRGELENMCRGTVRCLTLKPKDRQVIAHANILTNTSLASAG